VAGSETPSGLFVGLTTFDLVHYVERFPRDDEKIQALARWIGAGGPAANAASTFVALGGRATLLTAIGDGILPRAALADLSALGVRVIDLSVDGNLPTSSVVVDQSGHRTVVSLNAQGFDDEAMATRLPDLEQVDVVTVDSHYPQLVLRALAKLTERPVPIVFDPGSYKVHVFELMAKCNHVIASRSLDPTVPSAELLGRLQGSDVTLAAVTAGSDPTLVAVGNEQFELPVPRIQALDTVGAGDVLHGAYAYYVSIGLPVRDAIKKATSIAARSCELHGPRPDSVPPTLVNS
jgi:sugar/nucleoside kinase (ribokinase family)